MKSILLISSVVAILGCEMASRPAERVETAPADPIGLSIDPPAGDYPTAPFLTIVDGNPALSWLERREQADGAQRHLFLMSRRDGDRWSEPVSIASGSDFFANWADVPGLVETENGDLYGHWLEKTAPETYAYSIRLARSKDGGETWKDLGWLNDDGTPTEHGFVSYTTEDGGVRAFWLDGRAMVDGGAMALRTAWIGEDVGATEVLDDRVCECCPTTATATASGPMVLFRDRSESEIRDIGVVRRSSDTWLSTRHVNDDGWRIPGCPVNGPAAASIESTVAVAWFTASGDRPAVKVAFSRDAGASFEKALEIDSGEPLGRVGIVLDTPETAWVSWMRSSHDRAELVLRAVGRTGDLGRPLIVATTSATRSSGIPRLIRHQEHLYLAWMDLTDSTEDQSGRLRVQRIEIADLPGLEDTT